MSEHILKTQHEAWLAVESGAKRFEVRRNDRFFQSGDTVVLRKLAKDNPSYCERAPNGGLSSTRDLKFTIGWILQGGRFGLEPGYCVFQLETPPHQSEKEG